MARGGRKDTFVIAGEWWKHLRPWLKRKTAKKERSAAKKRIEKETFER